MSTRWGTQCGCSRRADSPGARGEEGPRGALGPPQDRRIWKKVCPGEGRGQLLPWEEAPIGRIYASDRSPLEGRPLCLLGVLLSVPLLGVSQWSGHCKPTSTSRFLVPCGGHPSGGERLCAPPGSAPTCWRVLPTPPGHPVPVLSSLLPSGGVLLDVQL